MIGRGSYMYEHSGIHACNAILCRTFLKLRAVCSFFFLICSLICSHLRILLSSFEIFSIAMVSKDGMTTHVDTSAPDYDLGLSTDEDAAVLGMFIIACQSPRLTFNLSETRLQAGVASKLLQARNFCNRVQYYGAFAFYGLNSQLFHSCWASWYGLGQSRRA